MAFLQLISRLKGSRPRTHRPSISPRSPLVKSIRTLALWSLLAVMLLGRSSFGQSVLQGFVIETIADVHDAVAVAFTPNGQRMFVCTKGGLVRIVVDGQLLPVPFLNLSDEVDGRGDKGLLGIDVHPDFEQNGYVFLLYVVDATPGAPILFNETPSLGRVVRYTAQGNTADPASRTVLLGHEASASDGFIICFNSHATGTVKFGLDGSLFVGSGDGAHWDFVDHGQDVTEFDPQCAALFGEENDIGSWRAQNTASLAGKILRLDPETGEGLSDNPDFDGDPSTVVSKTWVRGLRNPYRFAVRPGSDGPGTLYIGDVGGVLFEEMNVALGGENFGWPCYEGAPPSSDFLNDSVIGPLCQGLSSASITEPLIYWDHSDPAIGGFTGNCASGMVFYAGNRYPPRYQGACFFADYVEDWIKVAFVNANNVLLGVEDFVEGLDRPVDLATCPVSGDLVYVSLAGSVGRISFVGENVVPGDCNADGVLDISDGTCALGVLFTGEPAVFPCGDGSSTDPANITLMDWQSVGAGGGDLDISDAIGLLRFLFLGEIAHPLAVPGLEREECVLIPDCPTSCQ